MPLLIALIIIILRSQGHIMRVIDYNKAISEAPSADQTVVPSFAVILLIMNNKILNQEKTDGKIHLKAIL